MQLFILEMRSFLAGILLMLLANAEGRYRIGVNYGQLGDNLPPPSKAVAWIRSLGIGYVKIYDANPSILRALAGSGIKVSIMVTNGEIASVATDQSFADLWVKDNVTVYYPHTHIRTILIGNEILSDATNNQTWLQLVPAMLNIRSALEKYKLHHRIKVSTPLAMDMLQGTIFPPSNGTFRGNIAESVMKPMLRYLDRTRSSLYIDVYPFFEREYNAATISLDFALFASNTSYIDPFNGGLHYTNLLDVQLDAVLAAMTKLGYGNVKRTVSETGWPTKQDVDERGANIHNAALYNRRLVRKMVAKPTMGTPMRPKEVIRTFIFALFNENLKPGPTTERNWGLLYPNGSRVYEVDLTGQLPDSAYPPLLPAPPEPPIGSLKFWCVANPNSTASELQGGLDYACSVDPSFCEPIQPEGACYQPNTLLSHASYAYNRYYIVYKRLGGNCNFSGSANVTTHDPSYGSCTYTPFIL